MALDSGLSAPHSESSFLFHQKWLEFVVKQLSRPTSGLLSSYFWYKDSEASFHFELSLFTLVQVNSFKKVYVSYVTSYIPFYWANTTSRFIPMIGPFLVCFRLLWNKALRSLGSSVVKPRTSKRHIIKILRSPIIYLRSRDTPFSTSEFLISGFTVIPFIFTLRQCFTEFVPFLQTISYFGSFCWLLLQSSIFLLNSAEKLKCPLKLISSSTLPYTAERNQLILLIFIQYPLNQIYQFIRCIFYFQITTDHNVAKFFTTTGHELPFLCALVATS